MTTRRTTFRLFAFVIVRSSFVFSRQTIQLRRLSDQAGQDINDILAIALATYLCMGKDYMFMYELR